MNNKRQTIWLVSMLSLMVILSAYYLFTEDVNPSQVATDGTQQEQVKGDATEASGTTANDEGITVTDVTDGTSANATDSNATDSTSNAAQEQGTATDPAATAAANQEDEEVLRQLEEAGGFSASVFSQMQEKRDQKLYDEYNKLYGTISDTKQDDKAAGSAVEQLNLLEDKSSKITGLEEELVKQFSNAAVYPDGDRYKVVVQSDKLEKSQADSILTMVITELGVSPEQVTIQYVK
ncbi:SpoIIIAH-like family protein [Paenibacillus lignilyticus]|uniref:SpoIIIAH-like family protein n=1 Tax=Paenibacillus lignilyticus TaxID=1172615 RepID=A0ABS5CEG2_9BACL|nr:SpoIIIAH-like family protein [Paenibacillus lignilyticus]MBP3964364.1 SpoIIIAH-like family protein [Paenibacillus lignilyticus]